MKCTADEVEIPEDEKELEARGFKDYTVVIMTESSYAKMIAVNDFCRKHGVKFISCDARGVFARIFNDFGSEFEILDKDGEELQDVMVKSITSEKEGIVELLAGTRHNF